MGALNRFIYRVVTIALGTCLGIILFILVAINFLAYQWDEFQRDLDTGRTYYPTYTTPTYPTP